MRPPVKRKYDASKRREAAARTREEILSAAQALFGDRGYAATPMTAIAERAGVALDTVYASAGRKPELARLLIETAISGSSQAVPAAGRLAPVLGIIQQAAPAEPELASLWREISERRAANMHRFVTDLAAVATLRVDSGAAADIVWATNAPELYQLLVCQRGWTPERYEQFLADSWQRLLLAG